MKIIPSSASGRFYIEEMALGEDNRVDRGIAGYKKSSLWGKIQALFGFAITVKDEANETYYLNKKSATKWIRTQDPDRLPPRHAVPDNTSIITMLNDINDNHKRVREALEATVRGREAINSANDFVAAATSPIEWDEASLESVKHLEVLPLKKFARLPEDGVDIIRAFPNLKTVEVSLEHLNKEELGQFIQLKEALPTVTFRSESFPIEDYLAAFIEKDIHKTLRFLVVEFGTNLLPKTETSFEEKQNLNQLFLFLMVEFIENNGFQAEQFRAFSEEEKRNLLALLTTPYFESFLAKVALWAELDQNFYADLLDLVFTQQTPNQFVRFFFLSHQRSRNLLNAFFDNLTKEGIERFYDHFRNFDDMSILPSKWQKPSYTQKIREDLSSKLLLLLLSTRCEMSRPDTNQVLEILHVMSERAPSSFKLNLLDFSSEKRYLEPYFDLKEILDILNKDDYLDHAAELQELLKKDSSSVEADKFKFIGTSLADIDFDVEKKAQLVSLIEGDSIAISFISRALYSSDPETLPKVLEAFLNKHDKPGFLFKIRQLLPEFNSEQKLKIALDCVKALGSPESLIQLFSAGSGKGRKVKLSPAEINKVFADSGLTPSTKQYAP